MNFQQKISSISRYISAPHVVSTHFILKVTRVWQTFAKFHVCSYNWNLSFHGNILWAPASHYKYPINYLNHLFSLIYLVLISASFMFILFLFELKEVIWREIDLSSKKQYQNKMPYGSKFGWHMLNVYLIYVDIVRQD